jgi:hypothetical protein
MAESIDLQSEQFMTLLTDALRAGPGSPEWSQAVKLLRASDQNVDEYTLLYTAREHLESGKDYRSVRAGAGFTRKLMEGIDREKRRGGPSSAGVIAIVAGVVIVGVIVAVAILLLKNPSNPPTPHGTGDLESMIFGNRLMAASFPGAKAADAAGMDGWTKFGDLPLTIAGGELRPTTQPTPGDANVYKAGGWVSGQSVAADQPIEIDATVRLAKPADDEGIVQVFVSDEPMTDANAAGGHALVWQLKGAESRTFLPDGQPKGAEKVPGRRDMTVRIRLDKDQAIVDAADKRLYAGPNLLSPEKGRYVGVRFLRHGGEKWDHLGVASVVVQKP